MTQEQGRVMNQNMSYANIIQGKKAVQETVKRTVEESNKELNENIKRTIRNEVNNEMREFRKEIIDLKKEMVDAQKNVKIYLGNELNTTVALGYIYAHFQNLAEPGTFREELNKYMEATKMTRCS